MLAEGENAVASQSVEVPYPFRTGADLLQIGKQHGLTIGGIVMANEVVNQPERSIRESMGRFQR